MANTIHVEVVSAEASIFSGEAEFIVLPGVMGELGIYPKHTPLITQIKAGTVRIKVPGQTEEQVVYVQGGFLEVQPDVVTVLSDTAIRAHDLDEAKALQAKLAAEESMLNKTSKEEIVGIVNALELFLAEDEAAEMARYRDVCASIVDTLQDIQGLRALVEQDCVNRVIPHAVVYFEPSWKGPSGKAVRLALASGEPHIYVQQGALQGGYADEISVDPINLQPGDEKIVATRLREELIQRRTA